MREAFIRDYARTPIGRFGGSLASMRASASVRASPSQSNGRDPLWPQQRVGSWGRRDDGPRPL